VKPIQLAGPGGDLLLDWGSREEERWDIRTERWGEVEVESNARQKDVMYFFMVGPF